MASTHLITDDIEYVTGTIVGVHNKPYLYEVIVEALQTLGHSYEVAAAETKKLFGVTLQ